MRRLSPLQLTKMDYNPGEKNLGETMPGIGEEPKGRTQLLSYVVI